METAAARIALLNYGMGNLRSVEKALESVGAVVVRVSRPEEVSGFDGLVLPGVGAVGDCVDALRTSGLADLVRGWIREGRPFLGVCLGMQALFDFSEENHGVRGLGILPGRVVRFPAQPGLKVPHMGWNRVAWTRAAGMLPEPESPAGSHFYFVHSFHCQPEDSGIVAGTSEHGVRFCAAVEQGALAATQFHPEKSQAAGLRLYRRFVERCSVVSAV